MPYLRVLLDEVFGLKSFVAQNVWQKRYSRDNNSAIGDVHDYVICYAIDAEHFKVVRNRIEPDAKHVQRIESQTMIPGVPGVSFQCL
ncbi:MAG: hypothetical protein DID92_2727743862 [Candidatus Nitrotoga sp. SPKER]|nr:MAG: hypothetical protein DID92_2727743862 [Candidatus Nitrotoga sp. SPKER]